MGHHEYKGNILKNYKWKYFSESGAVGAMLDHKIVYSIKSIS